MRYRGWVTLFIALCTIAWLVAEAVAVQQYNACFNSEAMRSDASWSALRRHVGAVFTTVPAQDVWTNALFVTLIRLPYLLAALMTGSRRVLLLVLAGSVLTPTIYWHDVLYDQTHDCDRKGINTSFIVLLDVISLPIFLYVLISFIDRRIPAHRPRKTNV